jgi:outer membrane protein OmpA-like peptidoglycan-associated protein
MVNASRSFVAVRRVVAGLFVLMLAVGCAGPSSGPEPVDRGQVATVLDLETGAVLGAAPESLRWDRRRHQLLVAGHPMLSEADMDDYLEQLFAAIEPLVGAQPARLLRGDGTIRVSLPSEAVFAEDGSIRSRYGQLLSDIVDATEDRDRHLLEVAGHATGGGAASANQRLSESRARTVANHLAEQGLSASRILLVGYGEDRRPACPEISSDRVELVLVPLIQSDR